MSFVVTICMRVTSTVELVQSDAKSAKNLVYSDFFDFLSNFGKDFEDFPFVYNTPKIRYSDFFYYGIIK